MDRVTVTALILRAMLEPLPDWVWTWSVLAFVTGVISILAVSVMDKEGVSE